MSLTLQQMRVLDALDALARNGSPPVHKEIRRATGVHEVSLRLDELEESGMIQTSRSIPHRRGGRAARVTDAGHAVLSNWRAKFPHVITTGAGQHVRGVLTPVSTESPGRRLVERIRVHQESAGVVVSIRDWWGESADDETHVAVFPTSDQARALADRLCDLISKAVGDGPDVEHT